MFILISSIFLIVYFEYARHFWKLWVIFGTIYFFFYIEFCFSFMPTFILSLLILAMLIIAAVDSSVVVLLSVIVLLINDGDIIYVLDHVLLSSWVKMFTSTLSFLYGAYVYMIFTWTPFIITFPIQFLLFNCTWQCHIGWCRNKCLIATQYLFESCSFIHIHKHFQSLLIPDMLFDKSDVSVTLLYVLYSLLISHVDLCAVVVLVLFLCLW